MKKSDRLGTPELLALALISANVKLFFDTPRHYFLMGATAAWLTLLITAATAGAALLIIGTALEKHPGQGLPQLAVQALGKATGTAVNLLLMVHFTTLAGLTARLLGESIVMTALPEIPISVLVAGTLLFAAYANFRGLNALAKSCYVAAPFLAAGVVGLIVLSASNWNPVTVYPLFGLGIKETIVGGARSAGVLGEIIVVAVLAGTTQIGVPRRSIIIKALVISAVIQTSVLLAVNSVFPYPVSAELTLPYFLLSRSITIGTFLQRLEAIFFVAWGLATILEIAIAFTVALFVFRRIFDIKDGKPIILPFTAICFSIALFPASYISTTDITWLWLRNLGGIVTLGLPVMVATMALLKAGKTTKGGAQ